MFPPLSSGSKRVIFPGLVLACCITARAQLVCYEGFDEYAGGTQLEDGTNGPEGIGLSLGQGWGDAYNVNNSIKTFVKIEDRTTSQINYANGGISISGGNRALRFYGAANGNYAVRRQLGTAFQASQGKSLWFSFLFRTNAISPLSDQDFIQVGFDDNPSPVSGVPRLSIGANTSLATFPSPFRFFARSTTAPAASVFDESFTILPVTTYLLVARIQPTDGHYDTVSLFVNPSSPDDPGTPSATVTLSSGATSLTHFFIRTVGLELTDVNVIDELRIGLDYGSVVGSLARALQVIPSVWPDTPPDLRWPASLNGTVLETSTTLEPDSWSTVNGPFTLNGTDFLYPIPADPEVSHRFFRLRR